MTKTRSDPFLESWPTCFLTFIAVVEIFIVIILFVSELGNVSANFWETNVFAGGWCGIIILVHAIALFAAGCCSPGRPAASRAVIFSVLGLIASAAMISFDAAFLASPNVCILTPSCATNAQSNTTFNYDFQQSFYRVFRGLDFFKSYTESQTKFLFHLIQVGVGALAFLICIIYLIIYYDHLKKQEKQVRPIVPQRTFNPSQQTVNLPSSPMSQPPPDQQQYYAPPPPMPQPPFGQQQYYAPPSVPQIVPIQQDYFAPQAPQAPPPPQYRQGPAQMWVPPPRIPQAAPGQVPWNARGGY